MRQDQQVFGQHYTTRKVSDSMVFAMVERRSQRCNMYVIVFAPRLKQATDALGSNKADTAWTILAPTNEAFANRLNDDLNMTPGQLLQPENRETLAKVSSGFSVAIASACYWCTVSCVRPALKVVTGSPEVCPFVPSHQKEEF